MFFISINLNDFVTINPIITLISEVIINTIIIDINILPIFFGSFILPIDVDIVKNTSGIIITSNKFKNKSPNGLKIDASSLNINPMNVPIIIDNNSISDDL